jgi:hypothetical protein
MFPKASASVAFRTLACVAILLWNGKSVGQSPADRFSTEASSAWQNYQERAKRLQGSFSITFDAVTGSTRETLKRHITFKQREGCAFYLQQRLGPQDETGWARVLNPKYGFELNRRRPDGPWAVSQMKSDSISNPRFESPERDVLLWSTCPINLALAINSAKVVPVEPGFSVKRVEANKEDNHGQVRVDCSYDPKGDPRTLSFDGSIVYDPTHYWVILEYEGRIGQTAPGQGTATRSVKVSNEYLYTDDGFPILQRIQKQVKNPQKLYTSTDTYEFELSEANVDASEFTLTAFGLPEPPGLAVGSPTRWYLWAIILGVLCIGIAALLRWRTRRKERFAVRT